LVQRDGKFVIAGNGRTGGLDTTRDTIVARVAATGAPDYSFDSDGVRAYPFGPGADSAGAILESFDGTLLLVGSVTPGNSNFGLQLIDSIPVDDFADDGSADWNTVGSLDLFGACLRSVTGGASTDVSTWTPGPGSACPSTDGTYWKPVGSSLPGSKIAFDSSSDIQGGASDPTVNLRFGFRTMIDQPAGGYFAPLLFEVTAPNG
jgi:hypothetical protein